MWENADTKVSLRGGWYLVFIDDAVTTVNFGRLIDITARRGARVWGPMSRDILPGESWFSARFGIAT